MNAWLDEAGRRFARLATRLVVARPALWRFVRAPMRSQFDRLASGWEARFGAEGLVPLAAALARVEPAPRRVLDLGTGSGKGARLIAGLFPDARVQAVDLSPAMIEEARRLLAPELVERVTFAVADASELPYEDGAFDLVVLLNMIPFFDEVARVTAPGGRAVIAYSWGPGTPIYVPAETLRERLAALGLDDFEEFSAGGGTALVATRSR